ncbi:flagellar filament capping protein FliD [Enterobacteriaceae bacterium H16N7]|nr:flagellar filament capping protein FliD [Dryocola clanedunensis]
MINPRELARQFALMDVSTRAAQLQKQQNKLDTQSNALDKLDGALTDFQTAMDALNSDTSGPIVNTVSTSDDSATITADSTAQAGTYTFFVQQLAAAQQSTFSIADGDIPSSGTFTITMGSGDDQSEMDIDLSTVDSDKDGSVSVAELADAINDSDENPGVTATIVNTNGATTLMLTSDDTGAASSFSVSTDATGSAFAADLDNQKDLSTSQDAVIYLGSSPDDGIEITNSSNTFDDLIPGVSLTFTEVSTDKPLTFTVKNDQSATEDQVQTFVDAYNSLVDTLDSLTSSGGENSTAGPFAGDAGISSLERQIQSITHADYNGVSILDYGISLDKDGHLQIDTDEFNDAMAKNPDGLTDIFVGPDSMTAQLDDVMDTYLNDNDGIITQRQANIQDQEDQITTEADQLKETYNNNYDRYLSEYTATLVEISDMQTSMAAFA